MHILPVKDVWFRKIQRCYLPKECFSGVLRPGSWIFCRLSDGSEVMSRAFPHFREIFSQNLAYLDKSVTRNTSSSSCEVQLLEYVPLERVKVFQESVTVEVIVSDFSVRKASLERILGKILRLFTFSVGWEVLLEGVCPLPVTSVRVTSCGEGIGSVSPEASVKVTNIIFRGFQALRDDLFVGYPDIEESFSDLLQRNVEHLKSGQKFAPPNEILLVGSSGVGKTTLIHHMARKFHCNVFPLDPVDFHGQFPGESDELLDKFCRNVKELSESQEDRLSLVMIEDIDVLCPREVTDFGASLMNFLEALSGARGVVVVATAKDATSLSGNARRKGRLEVEMFLRNPNRKQREQICIAFGQSDEASAWIAARTSGFVPGDLKTLSKNSNLEDQLKGMRLSTVKASNLLVESDSVDLEDLGGLEELKRTIETAIVAPLKDPEAFQRMGLEQTKGVLLYGPPGCAKTTLVRALAKRTHMPLLAVSPAQVYSPYVGDSERFLTKVFHEARMCAPSILFIDELDALVGCRQRGSSDVQSRILAVLLTSLDGIGRRIDGAPEGNVLAVAATNRPDVIDEALMRPGRFDKLIHVPPPTTPVERLQILRKMSQGMPLRLVELEKIAERTRNFSGADLRSVCREAALNRLNTDLEADCVTQEDFEAALEGMRPSLTDSQIDWYRRFEGSPYQ